MLGRILRSVVNSVARGVARIATPSASRDTRSIGSLLEEGAHQTAAGQWDVARETYGRVLELAPGNADALYSLGLVVAHKGEYAAARSYLEEVLRQRPDRVEALIALGNLTRSQDQWQQAVSYYRRALDADPVSAPALSNLGLCLKTEGRLEEGLEHLARAYRLQPEDAGIVLNYALGLRELGHDAECEVYLRRAIHLDPDLIEAHTTLATLLLKHGSFREGWLEYEWRMREQEWEPQLQVDCPAWDGSPLEAKVLLVRAEQGLGDQIMFASWLSKIVERPKLCMIEIDARLKQIFSRSFPRARIYAQRRKGVPGWAAEGIVPDRQVQIGSLPERLGRDFGNFPEHQGYLLPDAERVRAWQARLDGLGTEPKVGLSWRGGTPRTRQAMRSVPLDEWGALLAERVHWISLQYTDCQEEIGQVERDRGVHIHHWQDAIKDYDETAALVCALDLVISVQTAIVHLGGALGRTPVWVMVPALAEWRYLQSGERLPWYPTVRLFRQSSSGEWGPVMDRVASELNHFVAERDRDREAGG